MTKLILISFLTLLSSQVFAGDKVLNGGDICEDRFKIIRDDIGTWITGGGPDNLSLPNGLDKPSYVSRMSSEIEKAKITCTNQTLKVGGAEKVCVNKKDRASNSKIVCNRNAFNALSNEAKYFLVHHEFAGLSGFESNNGSNSNYVISNQISEYLQNEVIPHLVIKKLGSPALSKAECVSRIVVSGDKGEIIRGPDLDINDEHQKFAKIDGYSDYKPWNWGYSVIAKANGALAVYIDLGSKQSLPGTASTKAIGFASGSSYVDAYTWLYPNFVKDGPCKIAIFRVVCAATKQRAEAVADDWGQDGQPSIGKPTSSIMPLNCSI